MGTCYSTVIYDVHVPEKEQNSCVTAPTGCLLDQFGVKYDRETDEKSQGVQGVQKKNNVCTASWI